MSAAGAGAAAAGRGGRGGLVSLGDVGRRLAGLGRTRVAADPAAAELEAPSAAATAGAAYAGTAEGSAPGEGDPEASLFVEGWPFNPSQVGALDRLVRIARAKPRRHSTGSVAGHGQPAAVPAANLADTSPEQRNTFTELQARPEATSPLILINARAANASDGVYERPTALRPEPGGEYTYKPTPYRRYRVATAGYESGDVEARKRDLLRWTGSVVRCRAFWADDGTPVQPPPLVVFRPGGSRWGERVEEVQTRIADGGVGEGSFGFAPFSSSRTSTSHGTAGAEAAPPRLVRLSFESLQGAPLGSLLLDLRRPPKKGKRGRGEERAGAGMAMASGSTTPAASASRPTSAGPCTPAAAGAGPAEPEPEPDPIAELVAEFGSLFRYPEEAPPAAGPGAGPAPGPGPPTAAWEAAATCSAPSPSTEGEAGPASSRSGPSGSPASSFSGTGRRRRSPDLGREIDLAAWSLELNALSAVQPSPRQLLRSPSADHDGRQVHAAEAAAGSSSSGAPGLAPPPAPVPTAPEPAPPPWTLRMQAPTLGAPFRHASEASRRAAVEVVDAAQAALAVAAAAAGVAHPALGRAEALDTGLVGTREGRPRVRRALEDTRLCGSSDLIEGVFAAWGRLLGPASPGAPRYPLLEDARLHAEHAWNVLEIATGGGGSASVSADLLPVGRAFLFGLLDAADAAAAPHAPADPRSPAAARRGAPGCSARAWSALVQAGQTPSRLEAALLCALVDLLRRMPARRALAQHLASRVYWYSTPAPEDRHLEATAHRALGLEAYAGKRWREARGHLERALTALEGTPAGCRIAAEKVHESLAGACFHLLDFAGCMRHGRAAFRLMRDLFCFSWPELDLLRVPLAMMRAGVRAGEAPRGPNARPPTMADAIKTLRWMLLFNRRALVLSRSHFASIAYEGHGLFQLGTAYADVGDWPRALACLDKANSTLYGRYPAYFPPARPAWRLSPPPPPTAASSPSTGSSPSPPSSFDAFLA
eukprot:tig00021494_g21929.t1